MRRDPREKNIVVMGVSGSGKSTIGAMLADRLGGEFTDGDELHPPSNLALMSAGTPLGDAERLPWLHSVGRRLAFEATQQGGLVIACSALKRQYRDIIRSHAPETVFVMLDAPADLAGARVGGRAGHFMPASLVASQLSALEPLARDEAGIIVDAATPADALVAEVLERLAALPTPAREA